MADQSKVTPTGWTQYSDASDASRVAPTGWEQIEGVAVGGGITGPLIDFKHLGGGGALVGGRLVS